MKKTYLAPALEEQKLQVEQIIAGSITEISGLPEGEEILLGGDDITGLNAEIKNIFPF